MSEKQYDSLFDAQPLMIALAKMAGMEQAGIKKMVLVLDMDSMPTLYIESMMRYEKVEGAPEGPILPQTEFDIIHGTVPVIDTTTMVNERLRTAKIPTQYEPGLPPKTKESRDFVTNYVGWMMAAERERLQAEAIEFLKQGYEPQQLTIARYDNGVTKVVTKGSLGIKE